MTSSSRRLAFAAILPALLLIPRPGLAGVNRWTETGPSGGGVDSLALDPAAPDTVYVAAGKAGVYKTQDGGASWTWSGLGMAGENLHLVVLDPARPHELYAATAATDDLHRAQEEVFRSVDGGAHWRSIFQTVLAPEERMDVAALGGVVYVMTPRDLFRSADGGASWTQVFAAGVLTDVEIDPRSPGTVYLGSRAGVLKSTDGGASWSQIGPESFPDRLAAVAAVKVAPSDPGTVYVRAFGPLLFRSTDGGATWDAGRPLTENQLSIAVDPRDASTLYSHGSGVSVSHDGGATFEPIQGGLPRDGFGSVRSIPDLSIRPDRPGTLYAATPFDGVYKTLNARRWRPATDGLAARLFAWLKVNPRQPSTLYASDVYQVYRSTDDGATWSPFANLPGSFGVRDIVPDPENPDLLFAAGVPGVYRSGDGGATWTRLRFFKDPFGGLVEVDPSTLVAGAAAGIYRTANGGRTWREVLNRSIGLPSNVDGRTVQWLKNAPSAPATVYGYVLEIRNRAAHGFLVRSTDGGATWRDLDQDLYFTQIAPGHPRTLYATRLHQVLRSDDGGVHWRVTAELPDVFLADLAVDPFDPDTVYAGSYGQGVYRSLDGGITWAPLNTGLARPGRRFVIRVVAHPTLPGRVYALPFEGGIFQGDF